MIGDVIVNSRQRSMATVRFQSTARLRPQAAIMPASNPHPVSVMAIKAVREKSHVVTKPDGQVISCAVRRRMIVCLSVVAGVMSLRVERAAIGQTMTSPMADMTSIILTPGSQVCVVGSMGCLSPITRSHEASSQQDPQNTSSLGMMYGEPDTGTR